MVSPLPSNSQPGLPDQNDLVNEDPAGDFVEQRAFEPQQGASRSRGKLSRGNLLLIGLFALAGVSVYFLSLRNGPAKANAKDQAVEQQVDAFITHSGDKTTGDNRSPEGQRLVEAFYEDMTRFQVPIENLHGNPFVFAGSSEPAKAGPAEPTRRASADDLARLKRKAEVEAEFAKMKLQGIMMGSDGGTAIVNNEFVTDGQALGSFTVTKINSRSVTLMWENTPFTLQIDK